MIESAPANVFDYGAVGDGIADDTVAIQAAINSGAGVVDIGNGTFVCGQLTLVSDVSLVGNGVGNTILKLKTASNTQLLRGTSISNISITGVEFDGNKTNQSVAANLLQFFSCDNVVITNSSIHDSKQDGVYFTDCANCLIESNNIANNDRNGISCGAAVDTSVNMKILHNIITGHSGASDIGLSLEPVYKSIIYGNVLVDNHDAITVVGAAAQTINCDLNVIRDNLITATAASNRGIVVSGAAATTNKNLFSGNNISGNYILGFVATSTEEDTFTDNIVKDITGANSSAFQFTSLTKSVVANNHAVGCQLYGMFFETSNNNTVSGNYIADNSQLATGVRDGIRLNNSSNNSVSGNYSSGADQGYGIKENGTVTTNAYAGNSVVGNNISGYQLVAGSRSSIDGSVYFAAAPTTGTWAVGNIVYAITPASGGFIGWVCTVAGTPGTWKTWGVIS
jgi:parallel beta-helix repeat protein